MHEYAANLTSSPLWNLPITDPRCVNASCFEFIYGYIEDQSRYSNYNFPLYAQWTVFFYVTTIGLFFIMHLYRTLNNQDNRTNVKQRAVAYWRIITYQRVSGVFGTYFDLSYGQLALLTAATIFISILPFFQGYFLRDMFRFGSPPLSVRCAMLISALLPLCLALAGKVNIVSLLTGISYAKLNFWHRYVAYVIYALSIVHTVPHIIAPIKEGGLGELDRLYKSGARELSGTVLFVVFTFLVLSSLPCVRNKIYELFKIGHIVLAIMFVGILFWHIKGEMICPDYLYGSIAILVANFVSRMIYRNRVPLSLSSFVHGFPTELEVLPGGATRVVIHCPQQLKWQPGQHCFISIPGISVLQSHPFTIVSLSWPVSQHGRNDLVLLVKALRGFTKDLADLAMKTTTSKTQSLDRFSQIAEAQKLRITTRAWIDGPYGDCHPALDRKYQGVVCVSGGSGITASLPWVAYLTGRMRSAAQSPMTLYGKGCKTRSVHLIWSIRSLESVRWAERELAESLHHVVRANTPLSSMGKLDEDDPFNSGADRTSSARLKITIFVTDRNVDEVSLKLAELELLQAAGVETDNPFAQVEISKGRPDYLRLLPEMVDKKRNIVLACGPQGQKIDVANSVAKLQRMVIANETKEIALHTETFGW